jgi:hypothetical protein
LPLSNLLPVLCALAWPDPGTLVYIAQFGPGEWGLYRAALGSAPELLVPALSEDSVLAVAGFTAP